MKYLQEKKKSAQKTSQNYPENDFYTTGKDYANDTLIRAHWFAENWGEI